MSKFIYLFNAVENAAQSEEPAKEGYAAKRQALLHYVEVIEKEVVDRREREEKVREKLAQIARGPWYGERSVIEP